MASGQLSYLGANPALLRQALAATGGDAGFLDELEQPAAIVAPAAPPASAAPAAPNVLDQALEATGSTYRLPKDDAPNAYGALVPGNLDLSRRPYVKNDDGSISTVRSMGVNIDGKEYLIPTVSKDGRVMSDDEAVDTFMKTGEHMGVYASPQASTAAGDAIHEDQMKKPPLPWRDGLPENPYNYGEGGAQAAAPISSQAFDSRASTKQLRGEREAGINEAMGLKTEAGEIGAQMYERKAEQEGLQKQELRGGLEAAKAKQAENDARRMRLERQADDALREMSDAIKNPPDATKGKALSIVGSILSMFPGGKGIGQGFQMLRASMAEDMNAYALKIQSNKEAANTFRQAAGAEDDENESVLRQQQIIGTMTAATYDAALRQIENEAKSDEERRAAREARLGVRQIAVDGTIKANEQRAAAAQQKQSAAADDAILRAIAGAPSPEQARAIALQFGARGEKLLGRLQKLDAGQLDIEAKRAGLGKTQAEIDELEAKAAATGPGRLRDQLKVQGLTPLEGATPQDKAKAQEITVASANLDQALSIMQKLQGSADPNDKKTYDIQWKLAIGSLNSLANAGVLNPGELEDWREKMPKHMYDNIGPLASPQAALVDEERVLGDMRDIFRDKAVSGLRTYNYAYAPGEGAHGTEQAPPGQAGRAVPTAASRGVTRDARGGIALPATNVNVTPEELAGIPSDWLQPSGAVQMVNAQTGAVKTVAPQYVEAYERAGWRRPQPAPAPQAGNGQS